MFRLWCGHLLAISLHKTNNNCIFIYLFIYLYVVRLRCRSLRYYKIHVTCRDHYLVAVMQWSHLLTRYGLTHPEVSSGVSPGSFCLWSVLFIILGQYKIPKPLKCATLHCNIKIMPRWTKLEFFCCLSWNSPYFICLSSLEIFFVMPNLCDGILDESFVNCV